MKIKMRLMLYKHGGKIKFVFQRNFYYFVRKVDELVFEYSFEKAALITLLLQIIKSIGVLVILFVGDTVVMDKLKNCLPFVLPETMNIDLAVNTILGGMGIAGLILGLYCANVVSVYSIKYANAPAQLYNLFQKDVVTNRCIKQIIGYISLCVLLLAECLVGMAFSYISMLAVLLFTLRIIVTFSLAGNRSVLLGDTYQISNQIYHEIIKIFKRLAKKSYYSKNATFQAHFQKICAKNLSVLKDISRFNRKNPSHQNAAACDFMCNNLLLLEYYWNIKEKIHHSSCWYRDKAQYTQWHKASDTEIYTALDSGAMLQPKSKQDYWWFEDSIEAINITVFKKVCDDSDFESICKYVEMVSAVSFHACNCKEISKWIHSISCLRDIFIESCAMHPNEDENQNPISAIYNAFNRCHLEIIAGINENLSDIDIIQELDSAIRIADNIGGNLPQCYFFNNKDAEDILYRVSVEFKLEKERYTPDGYIKQTLLKGVIKSYNEIFDAIILLSQDKISFGKTLVEKNCFYDAANFYSHAAEFIAKCELTILMLDKDFERFEKYQYNTTIIWDEFRADEAKRKIELLRNELAPNLVQCSGRFALGKWIERENYPDLLGFCYNYICEELISTIEANNLNRFEAIYKEFLKVVMLYQEYIRADVIQIKEDHRQGAVAHVATAPFVEYALISGAAILWGEFTTNSEWGKCVSNEISSFIKQESAGMRIFAHIAKVVSIHRACLTGIGNRDVLRTGWASRISNAMIDSEHCQFEHLPYGQMILKTDSVLVKAFCGSSFDRFGFFNRIEDVYFICCINQFLPEDSIYHSESGWEEKLHEHEST